MVGAGSRQTYDQRATVTGEFDLSGEALTRLTVGDMQATKFALAAPSGGDRNGIMNGPERRPLAFY
jgi:hypothetical protein